MQTQVKKHIDFLAVRKYNGGSCSWRMNSLANKGRPKSDDPRDNRVSVRFTDEEYDQLKKRAKKERLTIAQTIRKGVKFMLESGQ